MSDRGSGDNSRYTDAARLAVLEDIVRRLDSRLEQVSTRTHTLTSSVQAVSLMSEEAREQRIEILEKMEKVEHIVDTLGRSAISSNMELSYHVKQCDKRSARLEKIALAVLAGLVALAVAVATPYFVHIPH